LGQEELAMSAVTIRGLQVSVAALLVCFCFVSVPLGRSEGWQTIDADGLFTFRLPEGFTKTDLTGIEYYLGEYYRGKTRFLFISGDTDSNSYDVRREPEMENNQETETTIDGKRANIRTFSEVEDGLRSYRAELNVGDWEKAKVELFMELESNDVRDLEVAKQIFQSVKFAGKNH
jgi:hypothetical protein